VPALLEAARDRREEIRRAAFTALGAVATSKDAGAVSVLAEAMVGDRDMTARSMAAVSLGRIVDGPGAELMRGAYADTKADVRPFLVIGLGLCARRTADAPTKRFLAGLLADGASATETAAVCLANGLARNTDAEPLLTKFATTGDPETRCHAAYAIGLVGVAADDVRLVGVLRGLVAQSSDALLRREAALALGLSKSRDAVDVLAPIVKDGTTDRDVATAAVCLARVGGAAEADVLVARLADRRAGGPLRASVAHALGWLLDQSEGRTLFRFVADDDWWSPSEATDNVMFLLD
jgi:HEAT repeat protein